MNLIVTCPRNFEDETISEIRSILDDPVAQIKYSGISGIITATTSIDPNTLVEEARRLLSEEPWRVRYIMRAIPVQSSVATDLAEIVDEACRLADGMKDDETFRITVEKRHTGIGASDIIEGIAGRISNEVSLERPDWIIMIQIVGAITGIGLLRGSQILSVQKERRQISE